MDVDLVNDPVVHSYISTGLIATHKSYTGSNTQRNGDLIELCCRTPFALTRLCSLKPCVQYLYPQLRSFKAAVHNVPATETWNLGAALGRVDYKAKIGQTTTPVVFN